MALQSAYEALYPLIAACVPAYANGYPAGKLAEDGAKVYPYADFELSGATVNNRYSGDYTLEVNIWNNKGSDATAIEAITDAVFTALNEKVIQTDELFMYVFRDTIYRNTLPDPDVNIQRRQLRFIARIYEKEQ